MAVSALLSSQTDEHVTKTTKSYTLRRDMLKYIKRNEREWRTR